MDRSEIVVTPGDPKNKDDQDAARLAQFLVDHEVPQEVIDQGLGAVQEWLFSGGLQGQS